ncbi:MAG: ABC-F family ATP-binding cassette domain-containing protein [Chloroflexi bacterium]|nr:ABC-F family ATP-binding cassette domain-containing protein [Chloroflexota bacterium]
MISAENLEMSFGSRQLFAPATFTISSGQRAGLVGPNGAGKSTLLRLIAGEMKPTSGRAAITGGEVAYLKQEADIGLDVPLREEMWNSLPEVNAVRHRIDEIESAMTTEPERAIELSNELDLQHDRFRMLGGSRVEPDIMRVTKGLGFTAQNMDKLCGDFSGGWRMRISLAKILVRQPQHLMLDEPTNHLDRAAREWLREELAEYPGTVLIVTHDGDFLDHVVNRILSIEHGRVVPYAGNYSQFLEERGVRAEQQSTAADRQQRQIAQKERFIERFRSKATKARQVQSRIKMLEKIERIEKPETTSAAKFRIRSSGRVERVVLNVRSLGHEWEGAPVLVDVGLEVERGQKVALVGPNGGGKSTLLRILAGEVPRTEGEVVWAERARVGYYAQHQDESLDRRETVLGEVRKAAGDQPDGTLRGVLGRFLFSNDDVFKSVSMLSGGEKSRLALAKFLIEPNNVLLLDEPTNHLDAVTRDELLSALDEYDGTIICASHDPAIVDEIATHVYAVENGEVTLAEVRRTQV